MRRRGPDMLVLLAGCCALGGCQSAGQRESERAYVAETRDGLPPAGAFAPTRMRIHPLSHVDAPRDVGPRIVLHLEFEDRFGHGVKAAGDLQITLLEPGRRGPEAVSRLWEAPFASLASNAGLFDPTTRTYRIELGGLPDWAQSYARNESEADGLELSVQYEGLDAAGDAFVLKTQAAVIR